MHLDRPRLPPTTEDDWDDDTESLLRHLAAQSDGRVLNLLATVAHHPNLLRHWVGFGSQVLSRSTLTNRHRELVILRTGYLTGSVYEWTQHAMIARAAGCSDEEINRVALGPEAEGWSSVERVLLNAVDELLADHFISDDTWSALRQAMSDQQCIDLVFAVGQYSLVSMICNSFGVQTEPGTDHCPPALFATGPLSAEPRNSE
jgi:alkylhydroperoxidase family enzyme